MTDGMLHIPELWFFILAPLDCDGDVHALGGQKDVYEGLWYAVPNRDCAYYAAENQAHPCPMAHDNTFALLMKREYKIWTIHGSSTEWTISNYSCEYLSNQKVVQF